MTIRTAMQVLASTPEDALDNDLLQIDDPSDPQMTLICRKLLFTPVRNFGPLITESITSI